MFVENTSRRHSCRLHVHLFCVSSVALMILQTISYIRVQNSCDRRPPKALKRKMFVVRSRLLICKEQYFSCTIKELYFRITIKQIHSLLHVYNKFVEFMHNISNNDLCKDSCETYGMSCYNEMFLQVSYSVLVKP